MIPLRGHVNVSQGLLDGTVRRCVQPGPLEWAVYKGASVGLEEPVLRQQESAFVVTDSLAHCKGHRFAFVIFYICMSDPRESSIKLNLR